MRGFQSALFFCGPRQPIPSGAATNPMGLARPESLVDFRIVFDTLVKHVYDGDPPINVGDAGPRSGHLIFLLSHDGFGFLKDQNDPPPLLLSYLSNSLRVYS